MRRITALLLVLASPIATAAQQRRPAPPEVQVLSGGYDLTNEGGTRKCLVLLRPASVPGGYGIGFPAPCRAAFPLLASVAAWSFDTSPTPPRVQLKLLNPAGAVLLMLKSANEDGGLSGRDADQTLYQIKPTTPPTLDQRLASLDGKRQANALHQTSGFVPPSADPVAMTGASGTYRLLRTGPRDTGCILRLETSDASTGRASLSSTCADPGLRTFGPTGWTIAGGTLWLTSPRGRLSFERDRKGIWSKGPGQGEALSLLRQ